MRLLESFLLYDRTDTWTVYVAQRLLKRRGKNNELIGFYNVFTSRAYFRNVWQGPTRQAVGSRSGERFVRHNRPMGHARGMVGALAGSACSHDSAYILPRASYRRRHAMRPRRTYPLRTRRKRPPPLRGPTNNAVERQGRRPTRCPCTFTTCRCHYA